MIYPGNGDAAQSLMLKRSGNNLRQSITRLTAEVASGQHADKPRALAGNLNRLADVEHGIVLSARHATTAKVATTFFSAQQAALEQIGQTSDRLFADMSSGALAPTGDILQGASQRAEAAFADVIGVLNTKQAGRYVFSGTSGDQRPFAAAEDILADLRAGIPAGATMTDLKNHVAAWFAPDGGFDTSAYQGGDAASVGIDLGNGLSIRKDVTGRDAAMRQTLAGLALGAIARDGVPDRPLTDMRDLLSQGANTLRAAEADRIALQTRLGTQEARAADALAQAEARGAAFQILRTELLEADPFETATALEAATQRLDALYLVTARLARLSLTEYLR